VTAGRLNYHNLSLISGEYLYVNNKEHSSVVAEVESEIIVTQRDTQLKHDHHLINTQDLKWVRDVSFEYEIKTIFYQPDWMTALVKTTSAMASLPLALTNNSIVHVLKGEITNFISHVHSSQKLFIPPNNTEQFFVPIEQSLLYLHMRQKQITE